MLTGLSDAWRVQGPAPVSRPLWADPLAQVLVRGALSGLSRTVLPPHPNPIILASVSFCQDFTQLVGFPLFFFFIFRGYLIHDPGDPAS